MMQLARIVSFLSNPIFLLFPTPYILVYKETNNSMYAIKWTMFSGFFILLVAIFALYEVRQGVFTDLDVSKREQRPLLFSFVSVIAVAYLLALLFFKGPAILIATIIGVLIGIIVISFLNTKIKASIHVATIAALISSLSILQGGIILLLLVFIPLIAWARVKTKRHTVVEATVGGIAGVFLTIVMYILTRFFFQI